MITIIDYGAGNIKSIQNMLRKIGAESCISNQASKIEQAQKIILPGVGHFDHGMKNLQQSGLIEILNQKVLEEKKPILGICLGAQLLGNRSEEGVEKGLGWIPMKVVRFNKEQLGEKLKVPHMGWNKIVPQKSSKLLNDLEIDSRFYFVHSYHMLVDNQSDILATSNYGYGFTSAVQKENIYGVQFHPEKSHKYGVQLLNNFAKL